MQIRYYSLPHTIPKVDKKLKSCNKNRDLHGRYTEIKGFLKVNKLTISVSNILSQKSMRIKEEEMSC